MKIWKVQQEIYHRLNKSFKDDLNKVSIIDSSDVVNDAVMHFKERVDEWIYPAKSYFVAICYAQWISEDYDENFYSLLKDPMLLYGNDPYFIPYDQDATTYDEIIKQIPFIEMTGMVPDVREYYEAEFGIK